MVSHQAHRVSTFDACYGDLQRYYSLERYTSLLQTTWSPVSGSTNVPGNSSMVFYTNAGPVQAGFYRGRTGLR